MMLTALLLLATPLPAAIPNPSFERGLEGWVAAGHRGFRAVVDSDYPAAGAHWLSMGWAARNRMLDDAGFQVSTTIDARRYRSRRIRISAAMRISGSRRTGAASLFAETQGSGVRIILPPGMDWQRHSIELRIPYRARTITLGFRIENAGPRIEADDVRLTVLR